MSDLETPKTDFYIKLASEADMPSVLTPFYRRVWADDLTDAGIAEASGCGLSVDAALKGK